MSKRNGRRGDVPEVDVREAYRRCHSGEATLVDVREADELAQASIPGAIHLPLSEMATRYAELPHDRELLVICQSSVRSSFVTDMLARSGYERSTNVAGGIVAWYHAGLPVE